MVEEKKDLGLDSAAGDGAEIDERMLLMPLRRGPDRPSTVIERSVYSAVCDCISSGNPLEESCAACGIDPRRFRAEVARNDDLAAEYRRAREEQAECYADEIARRAAAANPVTAAADKVAIDALRWLASKRKPLIYGDKVQHTGADGGALTLLVTAAERVGLGAPDDGQGDRPAIDSTAADNDASD